jgi:putative FmdB family regulatory protein
MPTYEYVCSKCEHQFDVFQAITDKALTVCPQEKCGMKSWGKGAVKRVIGAGAGVIFKGSGFYSTDYRSQSYKEAAKKEAPPAGDAGKAGTKSESKPETKPPKTPDKSG